jgi:hypothetical protein
MGAQPKVKVSQLINEEADGYDDEKPFIAHMISSLLKKGKTVIAGIIDEEGFKKVQITGISNIRGYWQADYTVLKTGETSWFEIVPADDRSLQIRKLKNGSFFLFHRTEPEGVIYL